MSSKEQREYWRLAQRKHRIKQASLKQAAVFKPHITRFELCSFCGKWHPTEAILRTGNFARFSLDSFHTAENILAATDMFQTRMERCTQSRMQFYNEDEHTAKLHCEIILNDPLYRHAPPGVPSLAPADQILAPIHIDNKPWLSKDPAIIALGKCFTVKMRENPDMDPQKAVEESMSELKTVGKGEREKQTVGDLFGKSAAEIRAMTKKKKQAGMTVGDLFGQTTEEIVAFQKCVKEKMQTENMTREEAEKACEVLKDTSADRAGAKKKLPMAEGVWGSTYT